MPYEVNLLSKENIKKPLATLMMLTFVSSLLIIMFGFSQSDFYAAFPFYTLAFVSYLFLVFNRNHSLYTLLGLGVLVRVCLIFCFPNLSDDIYRFYWDGKLILAGYNPYGILPIEALNYHIGGLSEDIFDQLNSPNYYTIYPPINQVYFALGAIDDDIYGFSIIMKSMVFLTEMMGLFFILKLLDIAKLDRKFSFLYFLNPLVIIEGVGNLHFEVAMIAFLAGGLYFLFTQKHTYGSLFLAVSIGIKLLPLMLLPYFLFQLKGKERVLFFSFLVTFCFIIFLPMASGIAFGTFLESVDLYFRKFEFNASFYYVLRWIGYQFSGYNLIKYIGPILGLVVVFLNVNKARTLTSYSLASFMKYALFGWTLYLLFSTTVHPWYVISLLFFTLFLNVRYTMLWSYLIFMTYVNYSGLVYSENYWFVFFEYLILGLFMINEYKASQSTLT